MKRQFAYTLLLAVAISTAALAHDGRRFEVQIINGQLVAQGYISNAVDDGGGVVRPYVNAIHGHFANLPGPTVAASATLPGFDIPNNTAPLVGHDLTLEITGGAKWTSPATSGPVNLSPLDPADEIFVSKGVTTVSTASPGTVSLLANYDGTNGIDLDLSYDIILEPAGVLYVVNGVLGTSAPGILDSNPISIILSPDGANPMERLHHPSLYLESQVGQFIPEPTSLAMLGAMAGLVAVRPRKNR